MSTALLALIGCQLIGELMREALALPIPGPVIGMFLLAALLVLDDRWAKPRNAALRASVDRTAETLISHMGLLFVPAGVGIIAEADLLKREWVPIVAAVVISTLLSIVVTGLVMHAVTRPRPKDLARPDTALANSGQRT